ncbi:MAG: hypothetical protein PHD61_10685 [Bacteroidales bacterium]|nr:hypothetical protein [Lentimicrobiaceae bacterium]MDD5695753.1 hypothetical protein [Bacteroidales bacterium]
MKVIESETVVIHKPAQEIYSFLSNLNHFRDLMPPQVVNWQSTDDTCSFTIQGMTDLSLRLAEKIPFSRLVILPEGKPPFPFELNCYLDAQEDQTESRIVFQADLNPFLSMVALGPLRNFVNLLNNKLRELAEHDFRELKHESS